MLWYDSLLASRIIQRQTRLDHSSELPNDLTAFQKPSIKPIPHDPQCIESTRWRRLRVPDEEGAPVNLVDQSLANDASPHTTAKSKPAAVERSGSNPARVGWRRFDYQEENRASPHGRILVPARPSSSRQTADSIAIDRVAHGQGQALEGGARRRRQIHRYSPRSSSVMQQQRCSLLAVVAVHGRGPRPNEMRPARPIEMPSSIHRFRLTLPTTSCNQKGRSRNLSALVAFRRSHTESSFHSISFESSTNRPTTDERPRGATRDALFSEARASPSFGGFCLRPSFVVRGVVGCWVTGLNERVPSPTSPYIRQAATHRPGDQWRPSSWSEADCACSSSAEPRALGRRLLLVRKRERRRVGWVISDR